MSRASYLLTDAENEALRVAAGFLLSGEWDETITSAQKRALDRAVAKLSGPPAPKRRALPPGVRAKIVDDLKKLNGLPPYADGGNFVRGDGYFANSLVRKYGMSLEEMALASGFDGVQRKFDKLMRQAEALK